MLHSKTISVTHALSVQVMPSKEHQFIMSTSDVAHGYDCSEVTIRQALRRNHDDFEEGKHFIKGVTNRNTLGGDQPHQTFWTKRGVVRLGFFLKTGRAKLFRDWAEDLIVNGRRKLSLRDDEQELLELIDRWLLKGDQVIIANELGVGRRTVNAVKCGRSRSKRILAALVDRAMYNKRCGRQLTIGYDATYISSSIAKLTDSHDEN